METVERAVFKRLQDGTWVKDEYITEKFLAFLDGLEKAQKTALEAMEEMRCG